MRAGTVVPATVERRQRRLELPDSLNEGRDRSPGDSIEADLIRFKRLYRSMRAGTVVPATGLNSEFISRIFKRSMRAGTVVPATDRWDEVWTLLNIRSMRAGTVVPATVRHPRGDVVGVRRSMRAGTVVPATAVESWLLRGRRRTLNEGRDRSPGDSRHPRMST